MKKLSLVIFDMDGLMFDTERIAIFAWEKAGKDFGYEITPAIAVEATGLDAMDTALCFKKHLGESLPYFDIRESKLKYFEEYIEQNGIPIKEGLYELIDFLGERSILRAVATSTERIKAEECLSLAKVKDKFDLIVCGDDVLRGKPEPDIFLKAAEQMNCSPAECIVLEDSDNGLKAASRAGMYPIYVPDLKRPSKEVQKLIYKEFASLVDVKYFLETKLNSIDQR